VKYTFSVGITARSQSRFSSSALGLYANGEASLLSPRNLANAVPVELAAFGADCAARTSHGLR
jgi:hypothetical protein